MDTLSRRLKMLRSEAGCKQSDLAEALHTSVSVISNYENGREPPLGMLMQFAQYFGVTTDYLLGFQVPSRRTMVHCLQRSTVRQGSLNR